MRPVCSDPEQRPILKAMVVSGPQIFIHPMARESDPEVNVICKILGVVNRGYESKDWDPAEVPIQPVICHMGAQEVPPVGSEIEVIVYDDWYNWVVPEKRVGRLVIKKYPV